MFSNSIFKAVVLSGLLFGVPSRVAQAHEVYFCGEAIPTSREFVANRLMEVIRKQMPVTTLAYLRYQAQRYFPAISYYLKHFGLPDDLKYIPVVECGFRNVSSPVGARGFWQIMPDVARGFNLVISDTRDDRDDPQLATIAACKLIREHFITLKKRLNVSSWVLTAASYNFGPKRIIENVQRQGNDYFNMKLNAETAEYVYRLIAVKELFEHPQLYMNGFGANIFSTPPPKDKMDKNGDVKLDDLDKGQPMSLSQDKEDAVFNSVALEVSKDGKPLQAQTKSSFIAAKLVSDIRKLEDGQILTFELLEKLETSVFSRNEGSVVQGQAWIIDGRIFVDFGLGDELELHNKESVPGLDKDETLGHDGKYVLLKKQTEIEG